MWLCIYCATSLLTYSNAYTISYGGFTGLLHRRLVLQVR